MVMQRLIRLSMGVLIPAFMLAGFVAQPAMAQDKAKEAKAEKGKATIKVLFDNDKVRVQEVTFKPGDEGQNVARPFRIVRPLKGGTIQRTHPDGKIDKVEFKTGEVKVFEPDKPFTPKNMGKSDIVLYVVQLKEPKK
jgi:mannose-6-phosphate isomerase-like protein (cupin superfamily)